jgi:uncharacterized protein
MASFDPSKDAINLAKQGISLARWVDLDILAVVDDDRFEYGETRYRGYGLIDSLAYCLVFTIRDGHDRPISLRRAHAKEAHAPKS